LLVAGLIVSVLYVLKEHNNLRNEAIATVRDAATTIDHELRSQLLALQIISTSVDVGNGSFERVYQQRSNSARLWLAALFPYAERMGT
jgi:hypothetical protein